jgi:hypothetical protein
MSGVSIQLFQTKFHTNYRSFKRKFRRIKINVDDLNLGKKLRFVRCREDYFVNVYALHFMPIGKEKKHLAKRDSRQQQAEIYMKNKYQNAANPNCGPYNLTIII